MLLSFTVISSQCSVVSNQWRGAGWLCSDHFIIYHHLILTSWHPSSIIHHTYHLHCTTSPIMFTNSLVYQNINHQSSHPRIITCSSHHPIITSSHHQSSYHQSSHHQSPHQPITQSSDRFRGKQNTNDEKKKTFPLKTDLCKSDKIWMKKVLLGGVGKVDQTCFHA